MNTANKVLLATLLFGMQAIPTSAMETTFPNRSTQQSNLSFSSLQIIEPICFQKDNFVDRTLTAAPLYLSCGKTEKNHSFFEGGQGNDLKIAPNCVQFCFEYGTGRPGRCYTRCATSNNG